jgi:hypothetical protein
MERQRMVQLATVARMVAMVGTADMEDTVQLEDTESRSTAITEASDTEGAITEVVIMEAMAAGTVVAMVVGTDTHITTTITGIDGNLVSGHGKFLAQGWLTLEALVI